MGLFDGPPITDAQRELVAMTDARTREWYLEAEITMLNMRVSELEAALKPFADEAQFFVSKALDTHLAAPDRLYLTIGQFRAARKVLGEKE